MAGGEPRLGTTATYMRYYDHVATRLSTEIDRLHDRTDNEYRVFSAGSVRKWSKFGLTPDHTNEYRFNGPSITVMGAELSFMPIFSPTATPIHGASSRRHC